MRVYVPDSTAMERLGNVLAEVSVAGDLISLSGPLGAGKTTLARGFIRERGHVGKVKSPTFTLVEPYTLISGTVYHLDLYRLEQSTEVEDLGLRDYLDGVAICLIEWPERAGGRLPAAAIEVQSDIHNSGRSVEIRPRADAVRAILARLETIQAEYGFEIND
jgi:tRNA threonylcarbamoyladenosine biosynthesis protein TsaE